MAALDRVIDGIKEVLRMGDEIRRLSDGVKGLSTEVRDHDRRLVRLETIVEIAKAGEARKRLPKAE